MFLLAPLQLLRLNWIRWYYNQTCKKCPRYAMTPTRKPLENMFKAFLGFLEVVRQDIPEKTIISTILKCK